MNALTIQPSHKPCARCQSNQAHNELSCSTFSSNCTARGQMTHLADTVSSTSRNVVPYPRLLHAHEDLTASASRPK